MRIKVIEISSQTDKDITNFVLKLEMSNLELISQRDEYKPYLKQKLVYSSGDDYEFPEIPEWAYPLLAKYKNLTEAY